MGEYVNVCSVQKGWVAWDAMISVPSGLSSDELDEFLEKEAVWDQIYDPKNFRVINLEEMEYEVTRSCKP